MHCFGGTFGFSPLGWIVPLAFRGRLSGGIALVGVSLVRSSRATSAGALQPFARTESPLDVINARYAPSEIAKEQFNEIKRIWKDKRRRNRP